MQITVQILGDFRDRFIPREYIDRDTRLFTHNSFYKVTHLMTPGEYLGLDGSNIKLLVDPSKHASELKVGQVLSICHFLTDLIVV